MLRVAILQGQAAGRAGGGDACGTGSPACRAGGDRGLCETFSMGEMMSLEV